VLIESWIIDEFQRHHVIFVEIKRGDKDSQIFAAWMYIQFVEDNNDVQSSQISAILNTSESFVY